MGFIEFDDIKIFQKFLFNRVDYKLFSEAISIISTDDGYINEKWEKFKKNQIGFLVDFDSNVFKFLLCEMYSLDYKG